MHVRDTKRILLTVMQIMNSSSNISIGQVVKQSFAQEGVRWMFRGWLPAFSRYGATPVPTLKGSLTTCTDSLAPNSIVIFVTLEQLRNFVDKVRAAKAS